MLADPTWPARAPKVELHLHLEGAIPLPALWRLVQKYGGDPEVPTLPALQARFQYRDFHHFIATWMWQTSFLREYEDFSFIAEAVARDLAAQNIRYADVFHRARQLGLRTSAHAGEAAGAQSVWGAINSLQVDRIGHGTRALEDERLLDYLAHHQIPVEMCPISNLRTGVVAAIEEHPVRRFFDRGIFLSVNTDDPKMFGNSLADEYTLLAERLGFSQSELQTVILNGIAAAFLTAPEKASLRRSFLADPAWAA